MSQALTIVQLIHTVWTKASRGAPAAATRNRVPEAMRLPPEGIRDIATGLLVHEVWYREPDFETPRSDVRVYEESVRNWNALELRVASDTVHLELGAGRHLALGRGEYGRVVFNYFIDEPNHGGHIRYYHKLSANVTLGSSPAAAMFTRNAPSRELRALDHLP